MASNSSSTADIWTQLVDNYTLAFKYFFPPLTVVSVLISVLLILLLIFKRDETRFQASTATAITSLLFFDICNMLIAILPTYLLNSFKIKVDGQNDLECRVHMCFMYAVSIIPGYIQGLISIERVVAVTKPLMVRKWITRKRMILGLLLSIAAVFAVSAWFVSLSYKLNEMGECIQTQEHSMMMMILDFVVWVSIPSIVQLVCTVGIIVQLVRRLKIRAVTSAKDRLTSSEIRLSVSLITMNIIYIFGTSFFTFMNYHMHLYALYDSYTFFFFEIAYFFSCLGTYTDWIFILGLGTGVREAFKSVFRRRVPRMLKIGFSSRATMKTDASNLSSNPED